MPSLETDCRFQKAVYWAANGVDNNGEAKVEFYTSDRQTELNVIVNGIDLESGNPGQGQTQINPSIEK